MGADGRGRESKTCKTKPIWCECREMGADGRGRESKTCKTNPISGRNAQNEPNLARRERLTEENVQNEAKLGGTGVFG
jgi:hypothetical protein